MGITNNSIDQQYGRDTALGIALTFDLQNPRTGAAPIALITTRIVAAVLPVAGGTQTFTIAAQPDVPRNVTMTLTDANTSISQISAQVFGKDWWGNAMTERLTLNASGTATATGALPFWEVDAISAVTSGTVGGGDLVSFGVGDKLGIPVRLRDATDIVAKREAGTQDTTGVIAVNAGGISTWLPASVANAARTYFMTVRSRYGVIS